MGQQIKITFIPKGFEEILCSAGVHGVVQDATYAIQARANANNSRGGNGFAARTRISDAGKQYRSKRAIGHVYTTDHASCVAEAEDKALSRAL